MEHYRVNPNLQHKLGQSLTAFYVTHRKGDLNGQCNASAQEPISSSWPRPISRVVNLKRLLLLLAPFNLGAAVQTPRSGHARCQIVWCWNSGVTRWFVEFTKWPASWLRAILCENLHLGIHVLVSPLGPHFHTWTLLGLAHFQELKSQVVFCPCLIVHSTSICAISIT